MDIVFFELSTAMMDAMTALNRLDVPQTFRDSWGWQFPAISPKDLAERLRVLRERIDETYDDDTRSNEFGHQIHEYARRLRLLVSEGIGNMAGNFQAVSAVVQTIDELERMLALITGMVLVDNPGLLPATTALRLRKVKRSLDTMEANHIALEERVANINSAYATASALPSTLQDLEEARITIEETASKIDRLHEATTKSSGKAEENAEQIEKLLALVERQKETAEKLIAKCEQAYQITTTKGLAGAFDQRAARLNMSIVLWVIGLLGALAAGAYLGSSRVDALSDLLTDASPNWGQIILHIVLSILTVGGPLWFGWLATKQIGQRFRLAEDYAFKASVAKAYEGYRKQAIDLDPSFAARLFGAALQRLEEAPLRLVEQDSHGSPWHEMMRSAMVNKAIATVPDFQQMVIDLAKKSLDSASAAIASVAAKAPNPDAVVKSVKPGE